MFYQTKKVQIKVLDRPHVAGGPDVAQAWYLNLPNFKNVVRLTWNRTKLFLILFYKFIFVPI